MSIKKVADLIKENSEINKKYKIATSVKGNQTAIYLLIITRGFTKIKD